MNHYQHILLSVDFFAQDNLIAERARAIAEKFQAKLSIIHVMEPMPINDAGLGGEIPVNFDLMNALEDTAKQSLERLAANLDVPKERQWLEIGNPKYEIVRVATDNNVDLIVVGSHGRHGLALMLGSTTDGIVHKAPCDVLAVHLPDAH